MKYQIVEKTPGTHPLVIGFFDDEPLQSQSHIKESVIIDAINTDFIPQIKHSGCWLKASALPTFLFNLGKRNKLDFDSYKSSLGKILTQVDTFKPSEITLCLPELQAEVDSIKIVVETIEHHFYKFKVSNKPAKEKNLQTINLLMPGKAESISQGLAIAQGISLCCDLANSPANLCTPSTLAQKAQEIAEQCPHSKCKVLGEEQMQELGMNTILAVSKGSSEEAKFIELHYNNAPADQAPIVLVGKGITFDSGGLSLKPPTGMTEMKFDMSGAASVLGTMKTISLLKLPINVIALVVGSENLPGPNALKPGDVIESYSKKTIEVLNTDAEGRLILCDALSYAEQFEPAKVIDIATLTGAIIIALGHKAHGIMANNQSLCDALLNAGKKVNDKGWQLPLWDEYQSLMDSNVADISNMASERGAGSISAACFLSRFTKKYPWAHIDCAGTAWKPGKNKTASGRPVPLLVQFLQDEINKA